MSVDRRKKGCPNGHCEFNQKKVYQKADINFCPKCGAPLVFVCAKCYKEIENISPKHRVCSLCEAKAAQKKQNIVDKVKDGAGKAGKGALAVGAAVAVGVVKKVVQDGEKGAIKKGVEIVEDIARAVIKK